MARSESQRARYSSRLRLCLFAWLLLHQLGLVAAFLLWPSLLSLPYLVLGLLMVQGGDGSGLLLPSSWLRAVTQLVLSIIAAITSLAASTQLPAALSGHAAIDVVMLIESLGLLGLTCHCAISKARTAIFRPVYVCAPRWTPLVATASLLLLSAVALLQPCLASLPLLTLSMVALVSWGANIESRRIVAAYLVVEPFIRAFTAAWLFGETLYDLELNAAAFNATDASTTLSPSPPQVRRHLVAMERAIAQREQESQQLQQIHPRLTQRRMRRHAQHA